MRPVFCMNPQNWSCVSLLAATHGQTLCTLMLEMHLPKLDIPLQQSSPIAGQISTACTLGISWLLLILQEIELVTFFILRFSCQDARIVCQVSFKNNGKSLTFTSGFEGLLWQSCFTELVTYCNSYLHIFVFTVTLKAVKMRQPPT